MLDPCPWLRIMNKEFCKSLFLWSTTNMPAPAMSPFMWENWCRKNNKYDFRRTAAHRLLRHSVWQRFSKAILKGLQPESFKIVVEYWVSESWHNWCLFLTGFDDSCISSNFLNPPLPKKSIKSPPSTFMNSNYQHLPSVGKKEETYKKKRSRCISKEIPWSPKNILAWFQKSKMWYRLKMRCQKVLVIQLKE